MRRAAGFSRLTALVGAALASAGCGGWLPPPPPPPFSGDSAFALIEQQLAFGPRVPGTQGHALQLAWMHEYLRERADTVWLQPFRHVTWEGDSLDLTNVFASFRPELADRILLLAHWDTRPTAEMDPDPARRADPIPGANDGASGTAVLLRLADVLSRHSPPIGVDILLTDGEDYTTGDMYLGATYFATHRPANYRPMYGILLDMVGDRDGRFPVEGNSRHFAPEIVDRVYTVAEQLGYGEMFPRGFGPMVEDDHVPLNRAGIPTINIIDFEFGPNNRYWHTHEDDLHNVAPEPLEAVGRVLTALIYRGG
ncbi:MAG TPA: M28 family peptidase [Longimicrobiales bacterium]|nr:M28 family peptidase [Longimicrobiales bacterium]